MRNLLSIAFLTLSLLLLAQSGQKPKWGKVTNEELNYQSVSFEKEAPAVVLFSEGKTNIESTFTTSVYKRIKILDERGIEAANQELIYYKGSGKESISKLKAQTINVENGVTKVEQVGKNAIFDVNLNEYYNAVRFTFPNVKVGSILEFEYELYDSNMYFIDAWRFQDVYPVLYSNYELYNRSSLDYTILLIGSKTKTINSASKWTLTNLNSYGHSDFLYNPKDMSERVTLQLKGYVERQKVYNGTTMYKSVLASWKDLNKELAESHSQKKNPGLAKDIAASIPNGATEVETLKNVHDYFKSNFQWNGYYSIYGKLSNRDTYNAKSGNTADLNLLLNSVLLSKNFKTEIVALSTRGNWKIVVSYPYLGQFNTICNLVTLSNGGVVFMDASDLSNGLGYMGLNNYNLVGLLVDPKNEEFVNLNQQLSEYQSNQVYFFKDGKFHLTRTDKKNGFFTEKPKETQKGVKDILEVRNALDLLTDVSDKEVKEDGKYQLSRIKGETVAINDAQIIGIENPLKQVVARYQLKEEKRTQVLEFNFPFHYMGTVVVDVPEGYKVERPTDFEANHKLGNNEMVYYQKAEMKGDKLHIQYEFFISRAFFDKQFDQIKNFFRLANLEANKSVFLKKK